MNRSGRGFTGANGTSLSANRKKRMTNGRPRGTILLLYASEFCVEEGKLDRKQPFSLIVLAVALAFCLPSFSDAG